MHTNLCRRARHPSRRYGISCFSSDAAVAVFVNGAEVDRVDHTCAAAGMPCYTYPPPTSCIRTYAGTYPTSGGPPTLSVREIGTSIGYITTVSLLSGNPPSAPNTYMTDDGCETEADSTPDDYQPEYCDDVACGGRMASVRCCSLDGSTCASGFASRLSRASSALAIVPLLAL